MTAGLSVTLALCIAGASFAAGALLVEPEPAAPAGATGVVEHHSSSKPGYGAQGDSAAPDGDGSRATLTIDESVIPSITVNPGAEVVVANADSAAHTVTASDGAFSTGTIAVGSTGTFVAPTTPGTYQVFCAIHPSMKATITVA